MVSDEVSKPRVPIQLTTFENFPLDLRAQFSSIQTPPYTFHLASKSEPCIPILMKYPGAKLNEDAASELTKITKHLQSYINTENKKLFEWAQPGENIRKLSTTIGGHRVILFDYAQSSPETLETIAQTYTRLEATIQPFRLPSTVVLARKDLEDVKTGANTHPKAVTRTLLDSVLFFPFGVSGQDVNFHFNSSFESIILHEWAHQWMPSYNNIMQEWIRNRWQVYLEQGAFQFDRMNDNFVSNYARVNPMEDFAESFVAFYTNPDELKKLAPDQFDFMTHFFTLRKPDSYSIPEWDEVTDPYATPINFAPKKIPYAFIQF